MNMKYIKTFESFPQEKFDKDTNNDWVKAALRHYGYNGKYEVVELPLSKVFPTQFGEDYINASSEYEAEMYKKYINGEIEANQLRNEDFYPIIVQRETMKILDGNHRHAVHTMLNLPTIKTILI